MGKDREGKFHPGKGRPSGTGKEIDQELHLSEPGALEQYIEMAEKYTDEATEEAANVRIRHPNRNPDKGEERRQEKRSARAGVKSRTDTFTADRSSTSPQEILEISREVFAELANFHSDCCVSAYMRTHRAGVEVNEQMDNIAFKNLLQQITSSLRSKGFDQTKVERMLEPGYDLLRQEQFWFNLTDGLAVFVAEGQFRFYRMPYAPKEELLINTSFFVSQLVPVLTQKDFFYVLVISKKQARFYRADAFGMVNIRVDELPNGVDDVVHFEEKDDQKLFRTGSSGAGGGANYHGIGGGKPDDKENIAMYLDEVDETLWKEVLSTQKVPLLLAGVEYLLPIYRQVTNYNFVWDEVLTGNHERDDINSLHQQALEKMKPYLEDRVKKALADYGNHSASERTSSVPDDVIPASYYSRVAQLFAVRDEHIWGKFNEQDNELVIHETQQDGDECLLDKAVIQTLLHGGEVFIVPKEKMPADSKLAALMRY
ncbi:MAG TPA: hypothetical protein VD816_16810 [Ohtaekwangia sp.]|nr:hypothetical protein [Ohtaekwangia sp.]